MPRTREVMRAVASRSLLLAAAALAGCASYTVIKQAAPNPLVGQRSFALAPSSFEGMKIGDDKIGEAELLTRQKPAERERVKGELTAAEQRFDERLVERFTTLAADGGIAVVAGAPAAFAIRPVVVELEPGWNVFVAHTPAKATVQLHVVDAQGVELDVIETRVEADPGAYGKLADRLGLLGELAGEAAARYVRARIAAAK